RPVLVRLGLRATFRKVRQIGLDTPVWQGVVEALEEIGWRVGACRNRQLDALRRPCDRNPRFGLIEEMVEFHPKHQRAAEQGWQRGKELTSLDLGQHGR